MIVTLALWEVPPFGIFFPAFHFFTAYEGFIRNNYYLGLY